MNAIYIRSIPNVMKVYGCDADTAQRFMELRDEGHSTYEAELMAGLRDPAEDRYEDPSAIFGDPRA